MLTALHNFFVGQWVYFTSMAASSVQEKQGRLSDMYLKKYLKGNPMQKNLNYVT